MVLGKKTECLAKQSPPISASWLDRKTRWAVWTQGAAVGIVTFAGSKVVKFLISLSLPLFPAHLHKQLLPAWAALVATSVQKRQERSPAVLGQTQKRAIYKRLL